MHEGLKVLFHQVDKHLCSLQNHCASGWTLLILQIKLAVLAPDIYQASAEDFVDILIGALSQANSGG